MTDAEWLEKYALIRSESGALVRLKLRRPQVRYLKLRDELRKRHIVPFIVVLKARQVGMSSVVGLANLMDAIRNPGCRVTIVSNKAEVCRYIARRYMWEPLRAMMTSADAALGSNYGVYTDGNFSDAFGADKLFEILRQAGPPSEVGLASAFTGKRAGRSMTTHILHLSEVAYWAEGSDGQRAQEAIRAMLSSMPDYEQCAFANVTVESTAWGRSGLFHQLWQNASQGALGMAALFSPWYECDKYQITNYRHPMPSSYDELANIFANQLAAPIGSKDVERWVEYAMVMRETIPSNLLNGAFWWLVQNGLRKCAGSLSVFKREFPMTPDEAFTLTNCNFFSDITLQRTAMNIVVAPLFFDVLSHDTPPFVTERNGEPSDTVVFAVYERAQPEKRYVIGVDCALGSAYNDYKPAIGNSKSATVISVWSTSGEQVAEWWGVGVDAPALLSSIVAIARYYNNAIINVERNSIGKWILDQLIMMNDIQIHWAYTRGRNGATSLSPGSIVSAATRDEILSRFRWAVDTGRLTIRSAGLHKEMTEFIMRDGIRPEGMYRDDRIWAAAHAATVIMAENGFGDATQQETQSPPVTAEKPIVTQDEISSWVQSRLAERFSFVRV